MDRSEDLNQVVSPTPTRGAHFVGPRGQHLGIDEHVTVECLAGFKASASSLDPEERFFVEGVLNARDMEEHEGLFVWEELHALEEGGGHELDLETLVPALRRVLSASEDLDAFVRLRIGSDRESLPPRSLHVARFDLQLTADRKNNELLLASVDSTDVPESPDGFRLRPLRLWAPEENDVPTLSRIEGTCRWKWGEEPLEPGPWLILGLGGDSCRIRPLLWTVQGKNRSESLDSLQRAVLVENAAQRSKTISGVFDRLARNPEAPEWSLVFACLRLVEEIPPTVLPVTVELAKHPAAAAMALVAAGRDLPRIWHLLEELPFSWWQVGVRTWVRAAKAWRRRIFEIHGRSAEGRQHADQELREFLDAASVEGRFLQGVAEWIRVEVLGEPLKNTQLGMGVEIPKHVLEQERQSLFHRTPERRWPTGEHVTGWLKEHFREMSRSLSSLRNLTSGVPRFKRPVLAAPIVAAVASALDLPVDRPTFYEIRRLSDFDREWFDAAHMLALRVAVGVLIDEKPQFLT